MVRRFRLKTLLAIAVIVGLAVATVATPQFNILGFERGSEHILGLELGLDLAGGTHLIYEAEGQPTQEQMEGLLEIISRRVNTLGVTEPSVQQLGDNRLVIQLPGLDDPEQAKQLIGQTAVLEIIERICHDPACTEYEDRPTGLTGEHMARANPGQDHTTGQPILLFELHRNAALRFAEVTSRLFGTNNQLGFVLDGEELVFAGVRSPILAGSGQIDGNFTFAEVRNLAIQIESGRLPIEITEISSTVISPTLGARSLENALLAGVVGLLLVMFYMTAYYRASGFVASVALIFYIAIVLAAFKLIPVTLTLAGLAGFILSLGMAVDANVLIFERVKEEVRTGRTLPFSIQVGFNRAWPAIRDGNISTLIIAVILFSFGSAAANFAVTGFAVTLSIGVITSMFTAIIISKNLLLFLAATPLRRWPLFSPEGALASRAAAAERGA